MKFYKLKDHTMGKKIEQIRRAIRSPMRVLTIGVLINLALLAAVASLVWSMYQSLSQVGKEALEVQRLLGKVAYLNELSTMSARMGAVTGDSQMGAALSTRTRISLTIHW